MRSRVDLPQPDGPMRLTNSPSPMVRSMPSSAVTAATPVSNTLPTPFAATTSRGTFGAVGRLGWIVAAIRLGSDGLVGDVEGAIDDPEALRQLLLGDRQRRIRVDRVVGDHRVQVVVPEELSDR